LTPEDQLQSGDGGEHVGGRQESELLQVGGVQGEVPVQVAPVDLRAAPVDKVQEGERKVLVSVARVIGHVAVPQAEHQLFAIVDVFEVVDLGPMI
jgi:hypothetical protein